MGGESTDEARPLGVGGSPTCTTHDVTPRQTCVWSEYPIAESEEPSQDLRGSKTTYKTKSFNKSTYFSMTHSIGLRLLCSEPTVDRRVNSYLYAFTSPLPFPKRDVPGSIPVPVTHPSREPRGGDRHVPIVVRKGAQNQRLTHGLRVRTRVNPEKVWFGGRPTESRCQSLRKFLESM